MTGSGRRWLRLAVRCPLAGDRAALLADGLVSLGARGAEEREGWFVSYFPEPDDLDAFLERARTALTEDTGLSPISLEHSWQDHEEWAETWRRGLVSRRVGDRIVVHPSWVDPGVSGPRDIVITLDPGMAFGTAEHGTTRGCLRLLDGAVRQGDRVLDVGAGSGILSIAAAHLGASRVVAVEGDELACEAMSENLLRNAVSDRVEVHKTWATAESLVDYGAVEGIIANIESGLLAPLFVGFARSLEVDGWLIVSGILDHEWTTVEGLLAAEGFRTREIDADGAWCSVLLDRGNA